MNKKEKIELLTSEGIFHIFAIDHRDVLTVRMEEKLGDEVTEEVVLQEKFRMIDAIGDMASSVLVDTHYFINDKNLDSRLNMNRVLIGIERNNYDISKIDDGYLTTDISIQELAENGCNLVKLFVFYHPEMEFVGKIDEVIGYVVEECKKYELPLMLEPILYQVSPEKKLSYMKKTFESLAKFDIDIYKIEFPGDIKTNTKEENLKICGEINEMLKTPWIILSSGISVDEFNAQIEIAGQAGACGYAVGRSVWNPYVCEDDLEGMKQIFSKFKKTAEQYCTSL